MGKINLSTKNFLMLQILGKFDMFPRQSNQPLQKILFKFMMPNSNFPC